MALAISVIFSSRPEVRAISDQIFVEFVVQPASRLAGLPTRWLADRPSSGPTGYPTDQLSDRQEVFLRLDAYLVPIAS